VGFECREESGRLADELDVGGFENINKNLGETGFEKGKDLGRCKVENVAEVTGGGECGRTARLDEGREMEKEKGIFTVGKKIRKRGVPDRFIIVVKKEEGLVGGFETLHWKWTIMFSDGGCFRRCRRTF
jgi:hypothetical protein